MLSMENRISQLLRATAISAALMFASSSVFADSSVWKVSKGNSHIYLGGTIHVLSKSDFPLPVEFDEAYAKSDLLVFETDMARMSDPAFSQKMMQQLSYKDGSTIYDHLEPQTIEALEDHFARRSMSLDQFAGFKPSMMYIFLTVIELQMMGLDQEGVDAHYSAKATVDGKTQLHLESPQHQVDFIATIGSDDPDQLFEYTLRDLGQLRGLMETMLEAWREGDADDLDTQLVELMAADYPEMYETLLVKRNNDWMPSIVKYFSTDAVEFVLVGAAHLVGDVGLLGQLEDAGFTIEQL